MKTPFLLKQEPREWELLQTKQDFLSLSQSGCGVWEAGQILGSSTPSSCKAPRSRAATCLWAQPGFSWRNQVVKGEGSLQSARWKSRQDITQGLAEGKAKLGRHCGSDRRSTEEERDTKEAL